MRADARRALQLAATLAAIVVVGAVSLAGERSAVADDAPPNAERLRSAASEYDAGRRAFGEKDFEGAAAHFENAFHDAANASALRSAIRARRKANQLARAATLATLADVRYPKDAATAAVVREVLKESRAKLDRVTLRCTPDCGVAADGRAISLEDGPEAVFYLDPGPHSLVVSWSGDRTKTAPVTATAGGDENLSFEAPAAAPPPAPVVAQVAPVAQPQALPPPKPLPPAIFYSAAGLTVAAVAATVWSGVDAENNPGPAAVRRDCVGRGTSCPEYQAGLSAQLRTNVLIGVSAGLGAATGVLGVFFTRFSGSRSERHVAPIEGAITPVPGGGFASLRGEF
jgi:hypothetical protein